jgi:hypothetical protein
MPGKDDESPPVVKVIAAKFCKKKKPPCSHGRLQASDWIKRRLPLSEPVVKPGIRHYAPVLNSE